MTWEIALFLSLPPHTRGCTPGRAPRKRPIRASPAHAGMHPARAHGYGHTTGFPRTRGDAPGENLQAIRERRLPPHTRGCTRTLCRGGFFTSASPAHAGMHRRSANPPGRRSRFPRTRGDAPMWRWSRSGARRLPPHTRGCTRTSPASRKTSIASPAHAGMHRPPRRGRTDDTGFPRTRGDAPTRPKGSERGVMLPPHTRGCTARELRTLGKTRASPAHAGMHRRTRR